MLNNEYRNSQFLYNLLVEICKEKHYKINGFSYNYIIEISNNKKSVLLYGDCLPLNNNIAQKISRDKCALYETLSFKKIPCVKHELVKHPAYELGKNSYKILEEKLTNNSNGLVIKDNRGSCGRNVFYVKNNKELKNVANKIFSMWQDIAVSPFIENTCEYRVIILDGKLCVAYKKERPFIIGDGKNSIKKLVESKYNNFNFEIKKEDLNKKPKKDEKVLIGWKNNLCCNSIPQIITEKNLKNKLTKFAKKVTDALDLRFASIDIFDTKEGFKVLETNAIVSMEIFASISVDNYNLTKKIFSSALDKCFEE